MKLVIPAVLVAIAIAAVLLFTKIALRKKYTEFLSTLGFGEIILEQMTTKELDAVYRYITQYTRKGRKVEEGSELDKTLLRVAHKYEIINYI